MVLDVPMCCACDESLSTSTLSFYFPFLYLLRLFTNGTRGVSSDVVLGLLCAGVELETVAGGEVKAKEDVPCRRTGAVKGGREAWTEGPDHRVASCSG